MKEWERHSPEPLISVPYGLFTWAFPHEGQSQWNRVLPETITISIMGLAGYRWRSPGMLYSCWFWPFHLGAAFVSVKGATSIFSFPGLRRRGLRLGTWGYSASIAAPQIVSDHGSNMSDTQWLVPSPHCILGVKNKVWSRKLWKQRFVTFPDSIAKG